jgi:hypothetical protein
MLSKETAILTLGCLLIACGWLGVMALSGGLP